MSGWTKLFGSIVTSSIWLEDSDILRVWIAMLALADARDIVEGTIPGFASLCRVPRETMQKAIEKFSSPDPDSRTADYDGRRINIIPGGWKILNRAKYRERPQDMDGSRAAYFRDYRKKLKSPHNVAQRYAQQQPVAHNTDIDKEIENEIHKRNATKPEVKTFIDHWFDLFKSKFQKPYIVNGKKEGNLIKILLKNIPIEELKEKAFIFFQSKDDFIQKSGYTIGVFYSQINKLSTIKKSRWK